MRFVEGTAEEAGKVIAERLIGELEAGRRVLWLVCGGSNIATEVSIMQLVKERAEKLLDQLCIIPMDERYGSPGHADSNYKQLQDAGFEPGKAAWIDVLAKDMPLEETVENYSNLVATTFASAHSIIGVFGIGSDGHTAGVLPHSSAATDSVSSVVGYESPPFLRLTLTPKELIRIHAAYALAFGESKKAALLRLQKDAELLQDLPSSLLYKIPEAYVYNDFITSEE